MKIYNKKTNNKAMTLPELVLAVFMLTAFTGVSVMVTKYTSRFFQSLNSENFVEEVNEQENISSNSDLKDIVQDHKKINYAFDSIIEILSQPGINSESISNLQKCTARPWDDWSINSIDKDDIPNSYEICIKSSILRENNYEKLVNDGKPGIYILYAKPKEGLSVNVLPIRRIFCRPKPFCKAGDIPCQY